MTDIRKRRNDGKSAGSPGRQGGLAPSALDAADLDAWIARRRGEIVGTLCDLVRIPSVGEPYDPASPHPFGKACAQAVDAVRPIVEALGFEWRNHDYYAASARIAGNGNAAISGAPAPTIAFFGHIDVVPPGNGWSHDPFDPIVRDGCVFGRGACDDKGPVTAALYALAYLRERGLLKNHDAVLYLGCDEERGMEDAKHLAASEPAASVSLVCDSAFPVCAAEKGVLSARITAPVRDAALTAFSAGTAHNAVADHARAVLRAPDGTDRIVEFSGRGAHAAFPQSGANAIEGILGQLGSGDAPNATLLSAQTRTQLADLGLLVAGWNGAGLGIAARDPFMGPLTCVASRAWLSDSGLSVELDVRYPSNVDARDLERAIRARAAEHGFSAAGFADNPGYRRGRTPLSDALCSVVADVYGDRVCDPHALKPFSLPGATHAKWIPGAVGFGARRPAGVAARHAGPAHGMGHQPDEGMLVEDVEDAIRIYARAVALIDANPQLAR